MDRGRSALASVIGWLIVIIVAWWVLGFLLGTVMWILRGVVFVAVLLGLLWAYLALKAPDSD
jgi:hypothetical protein